MKRKNRDALFDAAAHGTKPAHPPKVPHDGLRQWAPQIVRKHKQGFGARQIASMTRAPELALNLGVRAIQLIIAEHAQKHAVAHVEGA